MKKHKTNFEKHYRKYPNTILRIVKVMEDYGATYLNNKIVLTQECSISYDRDENEFK